MKKILILFFFTPILCLCQESSRFNRNFFRSGTISFMSDMIIRHDVEDFRPVTRVSYSAFSFTYTCRFNLVNMSENSSISLSTPLKLGIGTSKWNPKGFASFHMPLSLDYNYGNFSTYNTIKRSGFQVNVGMCIMKDPLILDKRSDERFKKIWMLPFFGFSFISENKIDYEKKKSRSHLFTMRLSSGMTSSRPHGMLFLGYGFTISN